MEAGSSALEAVTGQLLEIMLVPGQESYCAYTAQVSSTPNYYSWVMQGQLSMLDVRLGCD